MSEWQMPKATRQSHPFPPLQLWSYSLSSLQSLLKELCMAPFCAESSLFRNSSGLSPLIFLGEGLADNIHGHFLWLYLPHWTSAAFSKPGHFLLPGLLLPWLPFMVFPFHILCQIPWLVLPLAWLSLHQDWP